MVEKHKDFPGQRAFCIFVNNAPAALVIADEFLLPSEVRQRYIDHTGFVNQAVGTFCFGPNVLEFDAQPPKSPEEVTPMTFRPPLDLPAPFGKEAEWALLRLAQMVGVSADHPDWESLGRAIAAKNKTTEV